jgi:AcrR family transcriptional regulator
VNYARHRSWAVTYSTEALCERILERHRDALRVQKTRIAVVNLARIVDATLRLANKQGFHATSLRQIAETSGLSMGGLYTYFPSKPMLLSMILGEVAATAMEVLANPPHEAAGDPAAHLHWIVATHVRLSEAMLPWFAFAFMEAKSFPQKERRTAVDMEASTEKLIADVLTAGVANGSFAIAEIELTAALIKPLLQDWYVKRAKYRNRGTSIEAYIATVTAFIGDALTPGPAGMMPQLRDTACEGAPHRSDTTGERRG